MKQKYFSRALIIGAALIANLGAELNAATFDVDYAVFKGSGGRDFLEIYFSIPRADIPWMKDSGGGYSSSVSIISTMFRRNEPIYRDTVILSDRIPDESVNHLALSLGHQITLQVEGGDYAFTAFIYDLNGNMIANRSLDVAVEPIPESGFALSDIEVITGIQSSGDPNSPFYKYGKYLVYPNAGRSYRPNAMTLNILSELYGLEQNPEGKNSYRERSRILDLNKKPVLEFESADYSGSGEMAVFVKNYDISSLGSGIYLYELGITDLQSGSSGSRQKKIYVYNPEKQQAVTDVDIDLEPLNEAQTDSILAVLNPLFSRKENKLLRKSTLTGKKEFLRNFWERNDPTPGTIANEYRMEIENRIAYADKNFRGIGNSGINSDQGRILMKYGFPTDIQTYAHSEENLPFITWQYQNIEGGVIFVFADLQQIDYYELIHSTKRNEIYDANWEKRIRPRDTIIENYDSY